MSVDTSLSEASRAVLPRMVGRAHVRFAMRGGETRLSGLDQVAPLRVLFPRTEVDEPPLAAVTTVSGGLVGGDRLDMSIALEEGASAVAMGQAAEKVYRSTGPDSQVEIALLVGPGGWLEWLPQETILFDGSRLARRTSIDLHATGRLMAGECVVFGRLARGEVMRNGFLRDTWEVRRDGRLVWADALMVDDDIFARLEAPVGFGGARAYATALYCGPNVTDHMERAKALTENLEGVRAGATCVHGVLVARWLSEDPLALRGAFERYWMEMRLAAGGLPARLPRLWYI
jgi:urease accessory protein